MGTREKGRGGGKMESSGSILCCRVSVPDRKFLGVAPHVRFVPWTHHPLSMCPDPESHQGKLTASSRGSQGMSGRFRLRPLTRFYRFVPSVRCKLGQHITTPSYRFASLGAYVVSLEVFSDGMVRSGAQYKGRFVKGVQHPRIFGRGHTGRVRDNLS
jgi:hypothetical protein